MRIDTTVPLIDTLTRHSPGGVLTEERAALHGRILRDLLSGKKATGLGPRVTFMAGGPGSGKSSLRSEILRDDSTVVVDVDHIRECLPEYGEMRAAGDSRAAEVTHEEASFLAGRLVLVAMKLGFDLMIDGVGANQRGQFVSRARTFLAEGYRVSVRYVTVPVEVAEQRVAERFERTGRGVPADVVRAGHIAASAGFAAICELPVDIEVYDNRGTSPELIARRGWAGTVEVVSDERYDEFRRKADFDE